MTEHNNPFIELVTGLNSRALHDLSEAMAECADRAKHTGKMATMTFQLKFKPQGVDKMEVEDVIKTALPEFPRAKTLMFVGNEGELMKDDPSQRKLELKSVDTQPTKFKEVK